MDAQILIQTARIASETHGKGDDASRLAFRTGYLEATIKELCELLEDAHNVMSAQKDLIERLKKVIPQTCNCGF